MNKQLTKANSTKAQRRAQALANQRRKAHNAPARTVRLRGGPQQAKANHMIENYRHCVMGPVAMPGTGIGFPDGDNRPTVTMDFRRTYTMSPDANGTVSFGIGTGFHGCFIKGDGTLNTPTSFRPFAIMPSGSFSPGSAITSAGPNDKGLIPIQDPIGTSFASYRPIVAVAEVMFTGSSMENGGSVAIAKTSTATALAGNYGSTTERPMYTEMVAAPVLSGSSVVGPARDSYVSRVVPADPEFLPYQIAAIDSDVAVANNVVNGFLALPAQTGRRACSLPCNQAGAIWYTYSGLHSTATITVNVRYCIQYAVSGNSGFAPLAKPSPPPPDNPGVLSRMFSAITSSPAALTFVANAVGHYAPSTRPLLAIAANAYNHA